MRAGLAVLLAGATASLYALSTSLQALEARQTPPAAALRATLIARLARRPLWLAGTAAGTLAWPLQAVALSLGSIALVQPALGLGLVVLLVLGIAVLHEPVGPRELGGVAAIASAVAVLGWAAPTATGSFDTASTWAIGALAPVVGALPTMLRALRLAGGLATSIAAGIGWSWVGLATSLLDASLAARHWLSIAGWAVAVLAVSFGALTAEMTALQTWPATRAVPIAFGLEMVLPAALAPFLTRAEPPHLLAFGVGLTLASVGAVVLGGSRAVASATLASGSRTSPRAPGTS